LRRECTQTCMTEQKIRLTPSNISFTTRPLYDAGRFALRGFLAADKKGGSFAQGVHTDVHDRAKNPPDAVSGQKDLSA